MRTRKGFTALSLASEQGHGKIVEILFKTKPDLFICDCRNRQSRYQSAPQEANRSSRPSCSVSGSQLKDFLCDMRGEK